METELKWPDSLPPPGFLPEKLIEEEPLDGAQKSKDPLNDLLFSSWGPQSESWNIVYRDGMTDGSGKPHSIMGLRAD
jgi:hypothetical protein